MSINTSVMQNFGLEDLSHVQSRRNLFKISCSSGNGFWLVYEDLSIDFGRTNFLQNWDMACKLGCPQQQFWDKRHSEEMNHTCTSFFWSVGGINTRMGNINKNQKNKFQPFHCKRSTTCISNLFTSPIEYIQIISKTSWLHLPWPWLFRTSQKPNFNYCFIIHCFMENIQKLLCEMQVDFICASKNTRTNAPGGRAL